SSSSAWATSPPTAATIAPTRRCSTAASRCATPGQRRREHGDPASTDRRLPDAAARGLRAARGRGGAASALGSARGRRAAVAVGRSRRAGRVLPRGQRLRGQERRQLLRLLSRLRQQGRNGGPGRGPRAVRAQRHGLGLRLAADPVLRLRAEPVQRGGWPAAGGALMLYAQVHLTRPAWVHEQVDISRPYVGDDAKVALAIELSRMNVDAGSGGPFGAAVFNADNDRIVSVGVNRVLPQNCSVAHAETMADMLAQHRKSVV